MNDVERDGPALLRRTARGFVDTRLKPREAEMDAADAVAPGPSPSSPTRPGRGLRAP